jgi:hypothetical protein
LGEQHFSSAIEVDICDDRRTIEVPTKAIRSTAYLRLYIP